MYRRWKESKGKDKEYENIIRSVSQNLYERIRQWPVIDIGGLPLVNDRRDIKKNRIAFKIWTAVPCVEKYKIGTALSDFRDYPL